MLLEDLPDCLSRLNGYSLYSYMVRTYQSGRAHTYSCEQYIPVAVAGRPRLYGSFDPVFLLLAPTSALSLIYMLYTANVKSRDS
jgi:hypothetical protein